MVPVATIFSAPELACLVSALEDQGIIVHANGFHHGVATLNIVALRGFSVRVPAYQIDLAVALIDEIRLETEPQLIPDNLRWGIAALFKFNLICQGLFAFGAWFTGLPILMAMLMPLSALTTPVPMVLPGDYRDRRGRLVQTT